MGKLKPSDRHSVVHAGKAAILHGYDSVAKWIVETPAIMNWETARGSLVSAAVERSNLDMVEYLSAHSPVFPLHQFGYGTASDLWAFLKRMNRPELFRKFAPISSRGFYVAF